LHHGSGVLHFSAAFSFNISTNGMPDENINNANKALVALYDKTTSGPHSISEQIRKIEEQTAKAEPSKLVEKALQVARLTSPQSENKKAA